MTEPNPSASASWTHTVNTGGRVEMLLVCFGDKIVDFVALPVDEEGKPT
jgi:hypothetical protein